MLTKFLQQLKDGCQFLFRKHADLKVQMGAPFGLAGHSTLTNQHEGHQKHAFGRDDERENTEWKWIKCIKSWDRVNVNQAPSGDQKQLGDQKPHITNHFCNYITDSLSGSPTTKSVMFQLRDCVNVVLRRIRSSSVGQWI